MKVEVEWYTSGAVTIFREKFHKKMKKGGGFGCMVMESPRQAAYEYIMGRYPVAYFESERQVKGPNPKVLMREQRFWRSVQEKKKGAGPIGLVRLVGMMRMGNHSEPERREQT